jgi:pantoate--beta-alanine ligase
VREVREVGALRAWLGAERAAGRRVGFVPTMGALHEGHLSLIRRAAAETEVCVISVFVNPLQFEDPADLAAYPRRLAADVEAAAEAGAAGVFHPPVEELYPSGAEQPALWVEVGALGQDLEGAWRPGHFRGVATVVTKLLGAVGPCRAYFGEKDYQQLLVVRQLVRELLLPVEVVGCPTVREPDGLARSSRNERLDPAARAAGLALYRALRAGEAAIEAGATSPEAVEAAMAEVAASEPAVRVDYLVVRDPATLAPLRTLPAGGEVRLLGALRVGGVRLIDNLAATVPGGPGSSGGGHGGAAGLGGKERGRGPGRRGGWARRALGSGPVEGEGA